MLRPLAPSRLYLYTFLSHEQYVQKPQTGTRSLSGIWKNTVISVNIPAKEKWSYNIQDHVTSTVARTAAGTVGYTVLTGLSLILTAS